ncbi:hypothetical protein WMY93_017379 [Mugilogobius chulae]|uniref:Uncharacterized protein n=1 Tax=Mugilogobius chulae TaxID=88201 RepID=A0AAW0NZ48_9GOBI
MECGSAVYSGVGAGQCAAPSGPSFCTAHTSSSSISIISILFAPVLKKQMNDRSPDSGSAETLLRLKLCPARRCVIPVVIVISSNGPPAEAIMNRSHEEGPCCVCEAWHMCEEVSKGKA